MDSPNDLTVPILTRFLLHASGSDDLYFCAVAMAVYVHPETSSIGNGWRLDHPLPSHFFQRLSVGIEDGTFPTFFTQYSGRLSSCHADHLDFGINLLIVFSHYAKWYIPSHRDYIHAFIHSQPLLSLLFAKLCDSDKIPPSPGFNTDMLLDEIMRCISTCMSRLFNDLPEEAESLLQILGRANAYHALEQVMIRKGDTVKVAGKLFVIRLSRIFLMSMLNPDNPHRRCRSTHHQYLLARRGRTMLLDKCPAPLPASTSSAGLSTHGVSSESRPH